MQSTQSACTDRTDPRTFGPLVAECKARGIGRSVAFELAKNGLIDTFHIGRRRFVRLDSLDSLPDRLGTDAEPQA